MARAKVVLDHAGMKALLNDPGVRADLTSRMQPVLAAAIAKAPFATGAYKASISLVQATTDRAVVRVVADAPHALLVESKTGNLARALSYAGGEMLVDREMVDYTNAKGKTSRITRKQAENYGRRKR